MPIEYTVTTEGVEAMAQALARYPVISFRVFYPAMQDSTKKLAETIVEVMETQPVARGVSGVPGIPIYKRTLRGAILSSPKVSVRGGELATMYGEVNADAAPHAIYPERGRGPGMPPIDKIRAWCRVKLGDPGAAWPVAMSIAKRGYKPYYMFARGWKAAHGWISNRFRLAHREVVRRLASGR